MNILIYMLHTLMREVRKVITTTLDDSISSEFGKMNNENFNDSDSHVIYWGERIYSNPNKNIFSVRGIKFSSQDAAEKYIRSKIQRKP